MGLGHISAEQDATCHDPDHKPARVLRMVQDMEHTPRIGGLEPVYLAGGLPDGREGSGRLGLLAGWHGSPVHAHVVV